MTAILFAPHNDDETLFAFYTMMRLRPYVVVVLRSIKQGRNFALRERETRRVVSGLLNLPYTQLAHSDLGPDWDAVQHDIFQAAEGYETVIVPAFEPGGHEDHNAIAAIAQSIPGDRNLIRYLTYVRGKDRSTDGLEVVPTETEWTLKRTALDLYKSQIAREDTAPWFGANQAEFLR